MIINNKLPYLTLNILNNYNRDLKNKKKKRFFLENLGNFFKLFIF